MDQVMVDKNMPQSNIAGVILTPLRVIPAPGGDVWHGMKRTDAGYAGFGEAYFSTINHQAIKPWKRHLRMTLNLIVLVGEIRFVLRDERPGSASFGQMENLCLSPKEAYCRLTVPPGIWMAFQGRAASASILINIADMLHDPDEIERCPLDAFIFPWDV
jgi:dTDP-4-dehydrorhamnose 3,5-epimerase